MSQPSTSTASRRGRPIGFDRAEALDRAMRVFWAKGFAAASMNDLLSAMGIASPSLYAAFGSKADLYGAAVDHYVSLHEEKVSRALRLPTARQSIEALLRNAVGVFSRSGFAGGCMVEQTAGEAAEMPAGLAARLADLRAANSENFATRLRKGLEDGDVPAGTDTHAVAAFYTTVYKGLSLSARGGAGAEALGSVVTSAMAAWPVLTGPRAPRS